MDRRRHGVQLIQVEQVDSWLTADWTRPMSQRVHGRQVYALSDLHGKQTSLRSMFSLVSNKLQEPLAAHLTNTCDAPLQ